jgi:hypothetical protein
MSVFVLSDETDRLGRPRHRRPLRLALYEVDVALKGDVLIASRPMNRGETVVARKEIGGFLREPVPAGTTGVVVDRGGGTYKVVFTIASVFGDRQVETSVTPDEVG